MFDTTRKLKRQLGAMKEENEILTAKVHSLSNELNTAYDAISKARDILAKNSWPGAES